MPVAVDPGIYDGMSADAYHADPCPAPSLSASIAHILLAQSPRHAWFAHPRLNPEYQREDSERFDLGTACHAYVLEGRTNVVVVDAPDWRTGGARKLRDEARAAGKTPLLREQWEAVQAMSEALRAQLARHQDPPRPFGDGGTPEQTLIWREGDVWCRARLDWLHADRRTVDDLKTTSGSANPDTWARRLFDMGFDIQAAFYLRGLRALAGTEAAFRFIVQETFAPYEVAVVGLGPDVLTLAEKKVRFAIDVWARCLTLNRWPGYPTRTCWAALPPWEEARWLSRETRDQWAPTQGAFDDGRDLSEQLIEG